MFTIDLFTSLVLSPYDMGNLWTTLQTLWAPPMHLLVLGLDNAGKTAVLYCLKLNQPVENTMPTVGFNVEELKVGHHFIRAFDLGGQTAIRDLWHHYYEGTSAIMFVIDSADIDRLDEARKELHALAAQPALAGRPFVILANKQDLPQALSVADIRAALQLETHSFGRAIHIVGCSAQFNERVHLAVEWLAEHL